MGKIIIAGLVVLLMVGCSTKTQVRLRTEVQESLVPLIHCPAPPTVEKPRLPIHSMTVVQKANEGEVAKHYKATVKVLQGYAEQLEEVIKSYKNTDKSYEALRMELETKLKKGVK